MGDYHENGSTEPIKSLKKTFSGCEKAGFEMALPTFKGIRYYVMNIDERRKHKRYNAKEGAFAALSSNGLIGQIKDLSIRGVSFTSLASDRQKSNSSVLEIFSKDNNFYLKKIPFKVVYEIDGEDHVPFSSFQMKQIGGEFVELTDNQISQLDYFLQNFAVAEA